MGAPPRTGRLVVLAGPSGVGKGTVLAALRDHLPDLWVSVSVTTRAPRPGEVEGEHYVFVDDAAFTAMLKSGELLEHDGHFGAFYGTPRRPVEQALAAGRPSVLEIDYLGARQVRQALGDRVLLVMLLPPSVEELERRLTGRGTEDPVAVQRRLARAHAEMDAAGEFDETIVNADVQDSALRLLDLLERPPSGVEHV